MVKGITTDGWFILGGLGLYGVAGVCLAVGFGYAGIAAFLVGTFAWTWGARS